MPSNWLYVDSNFPSFSDDESTDEKLDSVQNYLYMLVEQLRYQLFNLDETNLNETAKVELIKKITEPIEAEIENLDTGDYTSLVIEGGRAKLQIRNKDGDTAYWYQTADGFILAASDAESMGQYAFAAEGMLIKVSDEEGGQYATISETVNGLRSEVYDGAGNSVIAQTAETISAVVTGSGSTAQLNMAKSGIQLGVTNGEKSATITLTGNGISAQSQTIQFTGTVLFSSDLGEKGTTIIDGGRIQTGYVSANYIKLGGAMTVYQTLNNKDIGGFIGYFTGSTGEYVTTGVGMYASGGISYGQCCVSNAGAKIAYGANSQVSAYVTGAGLVFGSVACRATANGVSFEGGNRSARYTANGNFYPLTNGTTRYYDTLGGASNQWFAVYAYDGFFQNGSAITSDRNKKNSIQYGYSEKINELFDMLKPCTYKYNYSSSDRTHTGFIAQDLQQAIAEVGLTSQDLAAFVIDIDEDGHESYYIRYEELISLNTWQIQQLKARVAELERRLA